jgi:hypothetical protein
VIIAIPEALREKLGPEGARALVELLNEASVGTRGDVIEIAASRFERQLSEEIGKLRTELHSEIGGLLSELHSEIGSQTNVSGLRSSGRSRSVRPHS